MKHPPAMRLREYRPDDLDALAVVFKDAVLGTGRRAYGPAQLQAWSAAADDGRLESLLEDGTTLVAEADGRIAGFGQLHPADHVALLYTASSFARRGCATRIYAALEARASAEGTHRLHTEASRIARHFFLKMGFRVTGTEVVVRHGLPFERFLMEKQIG